MLNNLLPQTEHDHASLNSDSPVVSLQTNPTVSYGNNVRNTVLIPTDIRSILDQIRSDDGLRQKIEAIRAIGDEDEQRELKVQTLPYFSFCTFSDDARRDENFLSTNHLLFDIDHVDDLVSLRERLAKDDSVFLFFTSPRNNGLKVAFKLANELTDGTNYRAVYQAQASVIEEKFGIKPDTRDDPSRACFLSHDPDIYINENAVPISTFVTPVPTNGKSKKNKSLTERLQGQTPGNRIPTLASQIGTYINRGFSQEEVLGLTKAWNLLNIPPHDDTIIEKTVVDMYSRYSNGRYDNYWSYQSDILEFGIRGEEFFMNKIGPRKLYTFLGAHTAEERERVFNHVVKLKHIPHIKRVNYVGDVAADASYYEVKQDEGTIDVHYCALPANVQDNQFIENYLLRLFGEHTLFMKQYLAVYTYTNYRKLPTLIFKGERGTGKNTFAELIGEIYKPLSQTWHGKEKNFSPEVEKKFLIADETVSEDPDQYKTLKKYSGQRYAMVNKKYQPQYEVLNNMNIVILSNGNTPVFVEREEAPTSEQNNQFFVSDFKPLTGSPDVELPTRLVERLGHYIRTELKTVYDSLNFAGNRYAIRVPITDAERALFSNNATEIEQEADRLIDKLVDKCSSAALVPEHKPFVDGGYLPVDFIDWFYDAPNRKTRYKAVRNLKDRGFLKDGEPARQMIDKKRMSCYVMTQKLRERLNCQ
jgi:hypothetical protein